jgi:hypothetical protein
LNQTESVAFWIGLIASITGIVLSLVAIVFSVLVDRRSSTISDKTIQSLQKIESAVERSSSDTRELIKAAWDKMLGQVDREPTQTTGDSSAKQIAAGIAAELRSELSNLAGKNDPAQKQPSVEHLERYLKDLEASLSAQLQASRPSDNSQLNFAIVLDQVRHLSERSVALLRAIRSRHLSQSQYRRLAEGPLGESMLQLRRHALIVPVVHKTDHGPEPCYWMPGEIAKVVREAVLLMPKPSASVEAEISEELAKVGYKPQQSALN